LTGVRFSQDNAGDANNPDMEIVLMDQPRKYRIHPCNGNQRAWLLVALRADGTELDGYGSYTTAMSLDSLIAHAGHLRPRPCDSVEFALAGRIA
jgi:hypothetical protein